jgi:hypothetical protein
MPYAIEVNLKLFELPQDVVVTRDLGVGILDQVSGVVVHMHGHYMRLLAQVLEVLLDVLHNMFKVASERGKRRHIDPEDALGGGATRGPRRRRPSSSCSFLALMQKSDLFIGQIKLVVGDGVRLRR